MDKVVNRIIEYPSVGIIPVTTIGGSYYLYKNGYGYFAIPVVLVGTTLTITETFRSELGSHTKAGLKEFYVSFFYLLSTDPIGFIHILSSLKAY
jgi:hypothetical protein